MADNEFKYCAFLSYSPQDNREQAPDSPAAGRRCWGHWLGDALKTYSIPPEFVGQINGRGQIIPERIVPVFPDESELPEDASLSAEIRQALEQSTSLIVICSPRSAQSRQVNEVVRYFKQLGRDQQILPIVVAGEPNAGTGDKPGASLADECFVPALRHPVQPDGTLDTARRAGKHLFVDARHGVEKREILARDLRHAEADLEMAKIQLIALLLGVGFNGLWWREQQRHFFDFAEAQHQTREALNQVEEVRRQLREANQQTREAQHQSLELQNLPRDVQGQIQEAQNQALEARNQAREARQQLQEFQNKARETQAQLEEARSRERVAESRALEAQQSARESQNQLEATRSQARETQNQVLEIQTRTQDGQIQDAQNQILKAQRAAHDTQSQLEETRQQAQDAQNKWLAAQSQVQGFQNQAQAAQSQLEEARLEVREAQNKVLTAQSQAREAQNQVLETQNQAREAQSQIKTAQDHVQKIRDQGQVARRLTRVYAVLAVLALLAAGVVAGNAWRQGQIDRQILAKAAAEASGTFDLASGDGEPFRQLLQKIGGAEQNENRQRSLDRLAVRIPLDQIPEVLKAASVIMNDQQRSHFQMWLLIRLGWVNPTSAMTNASAIAGTIVNDEGLSDSSLYFQLAVLDNWMQTDWPAAFNWVCQMPDTDSRRRALDKIIRSVQSQPEAESKHQALVKCIDELAKLDVSGALTLAESLPEGTRRDELIAWLWTKADPFTFSDWISHLVLPPEIMTPRKASWPWTKSYPSANFGWPVFFPAATEVLSTETNSPVQVPPEE